MKTDSKIRVRVTYSTGTVVEFDNFTEGEIDAVRRSWAQITYPNSRRPKIEALAPNPA